jgi:hypothetical protein
MYVREFKAGIFNIFKTPGSLVIVTGLKPLNPRCYCSVHDYGARVTGNLPFKPVSLPGSHSDTHQGS